MSRKVYFSLAIVAAGSEILHSGSRAGGIQPVSHPVNSAFVLSNRLLRYLMLKVEGASESGKHAVANHTLNEGYRYTAS